MVPCLLRDVVLESYTDVQSYNTKSRPTLDTAQDDTDTT